MYISFSYLGVAEVFKIKGQYPNVIACVGAFSVCDTNT